MTAGGPDPDFQRHFFEQWFFLFREQKSFRAECCFEPISRDGQMSRDGQTSGAVCAANGDILGAVIFKILLKAADPGGRLVGEFPDFIFLDREYLTV